MKKEMTLVSTTTASWAAEELIPAISGACPSDEVHSAILKTRPRFPLRARSRRTNLRRCGSVSPLAVRQAHAALHVFGRALFLKCSQEFCCPSSITSFSDELFIGNIEGYIRRPAATI